MSRRMLSAASKRSGFAPNLMLNAIKKIAAAAMLAAGSATLYAAPVGNTAAPQLIKDGFFIPTDCWVDVRAGYEGDFVADARMKQRMEGRGRVDDYSQSANAGTATVNILGRLDIYGVLGSSQTCAKWRFHDAAGNVRNAQMETFHNFLWGVGARAILFEWGNCDLGAGGCYSSADNRSVWLTIDGINAPVSSSRCRWREWQVNLDVSYHIDLFTPYAGIKYSNARTRVGPFAVSISNAGVGSNRFANRVPVGLYVGCGLSTGKYFMLNVEGRFIDEEAVAIAGDLRF